MKKLLLAAVTALALNAGAQNSMYVDSVKVLPQNPTASDSVFLHIWWWSGYATTPMPPTVLNAGMNHNVSACYLVGLAAVVTGGHDSIFLFQGPAGIHMVSWAVMQNATQSSACDQFVTGNQQQVNVVATGIHESTAGTDLLLVQRDFLCSAGGIFCLYSASGQLVHMQNAVPGQHISVDLPPGQLYFATLTNTEGEVSALKFIVE